MVRRESKAGRATNGQGTHLPHGAQLSPERSSTREKLVARRAHDQCWLPRLISVTRVIHCATRGMRPEIARPYHGGVERESRPAAKMLGLFLWKLSRLLDKWN